jgi:hypothetical protein
MKEVGEVWNIFGKPFILLAFLGSSKNECPSEPGISTNSKIISTAVIKQIIVSVKTKSELKLVTLLGNERSERNSNSF